MTAPDFSYDMLCAVTEMLADALHIKDIEFVAPESRGGRLLSAIVKLQKENEELNGRVQNLSKICRAARSAEQLKCKVPILGMNGDTRRCGWCDGCKLRKSLDEYGESII